MFKLSNSILLKKIGTVLFIWSGNYTALTTIMSNGWVSYTDTIVCVLTSTCREKTDKTHGILHNTYFSGLS